MRSLPILSLLALFPLALGPLASAQVTITPLPTRSVRQAPRSVRPASPRPRTPNRAPRVVRPAPRTPRIHVRPRVQPPRRSNPLRRTTPYQPRRPRTYPRRTPTPRTYNPPPRRPSTRRPSWPGNPWRGGGRTSTSPRRRPSDQPIEHFRIGKRRTSISPTSPRVSTPRSGSRIRLHEDPRTAPPLSRKRSSWRHKPKADQPILSPSPLPPILGRYKIPEARIPKASIPKTAIPKTAIPKTGIPKTKSGGRRSLPRETHPRKVFPKTSSPRKERRRKGPGDPSMRRLTGGTGNGSAYRSLPPAPVAPKTVEYARRNFNGGSRHDFSRRSRRRLGFSFGLSLAFGYGFFSDCWYRYGSLYWNIPYYYDFYWSTPLACSWYGRLPFWARRRWHSYWLYSWSNAFVFLAPSCDYDPWLWGAWGPRYGSGSTVIVREDSGVREEESSVDKWRDATPEALAKRFVELGDLYFKTRRYALASDAYEKAVDILPKDGSLRFVFADALFATGDYDRAAIQIRQGLILHPSLAESEIDKHGFYGFPKDFDDHIAALRTYLKRRPYDANARLVLLYNLRFGGGTREETLEEGKVLADHLPGDPAVEALLAPLRAKK